MKRRAALALALCLTTIVGFFIVGYGKQIGFFGGGSGPGDASAQADPTPEPTQPPPAAPAEPQIIEQYVYRDVYVASSDSGTANAATGGGTAAPKPPQEAAPIKASPPAPTAAPAPQPTPQTAPKDVEFTGEITAVSGSTFTVESHSELFTVTLAQGTTVHGGSIEVGARVKVHGYQGADGVVTASEVEVGGDD